MAKTAPVAPIPSGVAWPLYLAEAIGTACLVAVGGSFVVLDFGVGSPVARLLPDPVVRRAVTGFLFGATGGAIALSPVGRESGAHINPVVTLAFWWRHGLRGGVAVGYVAAQMAGAAAGALCLRLWGAMAAGGRVVLTVPGAAGTGVAALGEAGATFCLVLGLFVFVGHRRLRRYTPFVFAPLYALLVGMEAPLSGTSTNPARTFGPALVAGVWRGWPAYLAGPLAGTAVALAVLAVLTRRTDWQVRVAKLYHFGHDPRGLLSVRGRARTARAQASKPVGPSRGVG